MELVWNWHITEHCNYTCHYCFAQWGNGCGYELWHDEDGVKKMIEEVYRQSLKIYPGYRPRLNFAGGEPLLLGKMLLKYAAYVKQTGFSTSVITNGSLLQESVDIAKYLDMVGISIDSINSGMNGKIGRICRGESYSLEQLKLDLTAMKEVNADLKIKFNTVVNQFNWKSELISHLDSLYPDKIKIFQQLPFKDEKGITSEEFAHFLKKNQSSSKVFIENNDDMTQSYLMIDPQGRMFSNGDTQGYTVSAPINEIGASKALEQIKFDFEKYKSRYEN